MLRQESCSWEAVLFELVSNVCMFHQQRKNLLDLSVPQSSMWHHTLLISQSFSSGSLKTLLTQPLAFLLFKLMFHHHFFHFYVLFLGHACSLRSAALVCTRFSERSPRELLHKLKAGHYNERLWSHLPAAVMIPADRQTAAYREALRAAMLPPFQLWRLKSDSGWLASAQRGRVWERQSRELGHCWGFHLIPPADPSHMAAWLTGCLPAGMLVDCRSPPGFSLHTSI